MWNLCKMQIFSYLLIFFTVFIPKNQKEYRQLVFEIKSSLTTFYLIMVPTSPYSPTYLFFWKKILVHIFKKYVLLFD